MSDPKDNEISFFPLPSSVRLQDQLPTTKSRARGIWVKQDPQAKRQLAVRAHDVTSALRALRFTVDALKAGYRFEDDKAPAKIATLDKAVQTLERESSLLFRLYSED